MRKTLLSSSLLISFLFFISCTDQQQEKKPITDSTDSKSSIESEAPQDIGRTNYAVIWKWTTDDSDLVANNSVQIAKELTDLWKADVVENAYYDADAKVDKLDYFPNISFFLKAKDETKAKAILNKMTVVTKGIASYELYPVGVLWLDRKSDIINKKGITKSFVTVWTTLKSPLQGENADDLLQKQSESIMKLWNNGLVENVYFDVEGSYSPSDKTDFVFYVNADTESEAKKICESLPFFKEKIAAYNIYPVGVFWMGKYERK